jgi:tetratricopeptide (TPR) repeat protein
MKQIKSIFCITLFLLQASIVISQQNISRLQPDAHAIGLGGSGVALTFDPSAIYWNPANIAFLTRDRIFINITDSLHFNYFAFTKFFPPSISLGLSFCQPRGVYYGQEFATLALAYRAASYFSLGTNFNILRTSDDDIYTSFGVGLFFKSFPAYRTTIPTSPSFWELLTSRNMKDKLNFGVMLHNIPINYTDRNYELRAAVALKPVVTGPMFHFAYHASRDTFSFHPGIQVPFFKGTEFYFGIKDLNLEEFAVGGTTQWGPFQMNLSYSAGDSRIYASLLIRLSEEENMQLQKHRNLGTERLKEDNFNAALSEYLKALSYQPDDDEMNYLVSVLKKDVADKSQKIDSLFVTADYYENKGWYIYAYTYLQKILELDLHNSRAKKRLKNLNPELNKYLDKLFRQGVVDYGQNELGRAEKIFQQIAAINKNHPGVATYLARIDSISSTKANEFYYRGVGYYKQGKLFRASQEFKEALAFSPGHKQAQEYLNTVDRELQANRRRIEKLASDAKDYEGKKLYIKAAASYRKILEIDSNHELARRKISYLTSFIKTAVEDKFQRARNLYSRADYSGAIAELREILNIDPDHAPSKNYLNRATQRLEALAHQHYQRAQNFYQQRDWDKVIQECYLTLSMNPNHNGADELKKTALQNISLDKLLERGVYYFQLKDYQNAKAIFKQLLIKEPGNEAANNYLKECESELTSQIVELLNLGIEFFTDGNYEEAIKEWNKVLKIDPNHKSTLDYIQKAKERLKALSEIQQ